MPRVLVAGRLREAGMARLAARPDIDVEILDPITTSALAARLPDADALIVRTMVVSEEAVAAAPRMRVVSRHGVGYDNVPVAALTARGIPLTVVGDVNAVTVAEHAIACILALAKDIGRHDRAVRSGDWGAREAFASRELWRKTLLILGLGRIGRELAKRAAAFDMTVLAYDPFLDAESVAAAGCTKAEDLMVALGAADFVSVHLPLTADTKHIIGAEQLAAMRPTAFLINTARGGLVDEVALDEALRAGTPAGAALDVFEQEPPGPDNPLARNDRVLLSPHIAGLTEECAERMAIVCVKNVLGALDGTLDPALVVNKDVLSR